MAKAANNRSLRAFSQQDARQLLAETFVQQVERRRSIPSTNDRALELARSPDPIATPLLVVTDEQTGGRGRGANRWWGSPGALAFSVLLDTRQARLPTGLWPYASLTAGLAVCEALGALIEDSQVGIKWPNDVWIGGRKVSGILVESPGDGSGRLVIGVGVNVNNPLADAPEDVRATATALCEAAGRSFPLVDVLGRILRQLSACLELVASRDEGLTRRWRSRCVLKGRRVEVDTGVRRTAGVCRGIDDDGALVLEARDGLHRVLSGVVTRIE